ncbi:Gnk2-like domain containing protein [Trema orientale]|uniref:Gnk2-like domain containing protein n=1 Tax=Trema orientale TaxID=63057 RepID=A0A2P5CU19_TREOI|nr:Gnk2-like domain containing protein [Trema orientale]
MRAQTQVLLSLLNPNSIYQSNLNEVLRNLSFKANLGEKFYRIEVGAVFGSYLCRGDVNATMCKDCVAFATKDATEKCPDRFRITLEQSMNESVSEVDNGAKRFLTKKVRWPYTLMQCTQDLSGDDCTRCLRDAIGSLSVFCTGKLGGGCLFASCNVRFDYKAATDGRVVAPSAFSRLFTTI